MLRPQLMEHAGQSALGYLLTQGVLGSLCVLLIIALAFTAKALLKSKDDRVQDQKDMAKELSAINASLQDLVVETNKHASELAIDATRSQDNVRSALTAQERSLTELKHSIEQARWGGKR